MFSTITERIHVLSFYSRRMVSVKSLILLGMVVVQAGSQDPDFFYFCTDFGNTWEVNFLVRENTADVTRVVGYEVDTNTSTELACDTTPIIPSFPFINSRQEISGDGSDSSPFSAVITINPTTLTADPDCGSQVTPPATAKLSFQTTSQPPGSWDVQQFLTCDFTDPTVTQVPRITGAVTVVQQETTIVHLTNSYRYEILNELGEPTSLLQSTVVILRATFLSGPGVFEPIDGASGISPHSCKLCDTNDCSGSHVVALTDSNGCSLGLFSTHAFKGDGVTVTTSKLALPHVENFSKVYFVCVNDYCSAATGMAKCQDRCGTLSGRKKRGLSSQLLKETREFTGQNDRRWDTNIVDEPVSPDLTVPVVVLSTSSVVLVATVGVSILQGYRLTRLQPMLTK